MTWSNDNPKEVKPMPWPLAAMQAEEHRFPNPPRLSVLLANRETYREIQNRVAPEVRFVQAGLTARGFCNLYLGVNQVLVLQHDAPDGLHEIDRNSLPTHAADATWSSLKDKVIRTMQPSSLPERIIP